MSPLFKRLRFLLVAAIEIPNLDIWAQKLWFVLDVIATQHKRQNPTSDRLRSPRSYKNFWAELSAFSTGPAQPGCLLKLGKQFLQKHPLVFSPGRWLGWLRCGSSGPGEVREEVLEQHGSSSEVWLGHIHQRQPHCSSTTEKAAINPP